MTSISTTAVGAKTYYAKWTPNTYTVNFNANGGTINSGKVTSYTYGTGATLPTDVTKTGYTFSGWYASADFSGSAVTTVDTTEIGDKTYCAKWTLNKYTITWVVDGVTTTEKYDYGATPSFKGSTDKASDAQYTYTFADWDTTLATVTGNKTYTATYNSSLRTYGASVGESQHGSVTLAPTSALVGGEITVFITPNEGYEVDAVTFNGVVATKVSENNYTFTMPAADAVVAVTYKKIPYTVTLINDGTAAGGSFSVNMSTATVGDTVTITVNPNLGYLIEAVTFNGAAATNNGGGTYSFTMPAQNVSVSVAFDVDLPAIAKELQLLNDADAALKTAINNGDNDLTAEIAELSTAITKAQEAIDDLDNDYATDTQLGDLKSALESAITTAKSEAISAANEALAAAKAELQNAINTNETDIEDKVSTLDEAYKAADALINSDIASLKTEDTAIKQSIADLTSNMNDADNLLQDAIDTVAQNLDTAKTELWAAINTNETDIEDKVSKLDEAYKAADALINSDIASLKTEDAAIKQSIADLTSNMNDADDALDTAIKTVQNNLNDAKSELQGVINANETDIEDKVSKLDEAMKQGDADLSTEITNLNTALINAKAALEKADANNKAALKAKIEDAESTLDSAINAVQNNLDDAKAELNKAIADGDIALDDKISALNEALATAKTALEATDEANKSELITKIDEADATLKVAIDALSNELNATNEKVAELQTFIIIVCVISGVSFCGCGSLAVFYIIDKKKKI